MKNFTHIKHVKHTKLKTYEPVKIMNYVKPKTFKRYKICKTQKTLIHIKFQYTYKTSGKQQQLREF